MRRQHLAAAQRFADRLGNFKAVQVPCPLGCGKPVPVTRSCFRRPVRAIDVALRSHYRACRELR